MTVFGLIVLIMALFAASSCAQFGGDPRTYTAPIDQNLSGSGITSVHVNGVAGSIKVVQGTNPDIIHLGGTTGASNINLLERIKVTAGIAGSVLQVTVDIPNGLFEGRGCVDLILEVPEGVSIETDGTAGMVEASNISGISISNTAGMVQLRNITGPVTVEDTAGQVNVQYVTGAVLVKHTSGLVQVQDITGNVTVTSTAGDVSVFRVTGDLTVTGCAGSVQTGSIGGTFTAD